LEAVLKDVDKHGICPAWPRKNNKNPRKTSDKTVKFQGKIQNWEHPNKSPSITAWINLHSSSFVYIRNQN